MNLLDNHSDKPNFHRIAFEEFFFAMQEGKQIDSDYVKKMTYNRYEIELRGTKNDAGRGLYY